MDTGTQVEGALRNFTSRMSLPNGPNANSCIDLLCETDKQGAFCVRFQKSGALLATGDNPKDVLLDALKGTELLSNVRLWVLPSRKRGRGLGRPSPPAEWTVSRSNTVHLSAPSHAEVVVSKCRFAMRHSLQAPRTGDVVTQIRVGDAWLADMQAILRTDPKQIQAICFLRRSLLCSFLDDDPFPPWHPCANLIEAVENRCDARARDLFGLCECSEEECSEEAEILGEALQADADTMRRPDLQRWLIQDARQAMAMQDHDA